MSYTLWRLFQDDDIDRFRQCLANATFATGPTRTTAGGLSGGTSFKIGSPNIPSTSPRTPLKTRKSSGYTPTSNKGGTILSRADVNARDSCGRTLLHHAVSSRGENALGFVRALLEVPFIDLYAQDVENGWTPLHRALYFGNVAAAQMLMFRDLQQITDYTINTNHSHTEGLIKIKDHEKNSPFEVFGLTIAPRILQTDESASGMGADDDSNTSVDLDDQTGEQARQKRSVLPRIDVDGDEAFTFGSNKNLSLGVGDEDDRFFPERIQLQRPDHLLQHLHEEHLAERKKLFVNEESNHNAKSTSSMSALPAIIRHKPIIIQDIIMSKFHTAVLTNDPLSNLYVCGFGPGGRLGLGDEATAFGFRCVQGGGIAKKKISSIALGQDHTIAVSTQSDVYTWGNNKYGQLGYSLPEVAATETPIQLTPRQLYGYIKKEAVIGAAASAIHSAIYTTTGLYTFGKNEGQLGLMDADARSLDIQTVPRRVGVSILSTSIRAVTAIDRATTVLLENHDVIVFTHYGFTRVLFPLEGSMTFSGSGAFVPRHKLEMNYIQKVTSGGNTICALSSLGEVFTVNVPKNSDTVPSNVSTTNPTKARNALPSPVRIWSIKKAHMAAIDIAAGQEGSVILCTASGSVWRKEKRANIQTTQSKGNKVGRPKDYKFIRVPNLTRAVAVRGNAFGAFAAIRKDCEVIREQIVVNAPSLWNDFSSLLAFNDFGSVHAEEELITAPRFWSPPKKETSAALVKKAVLTSRDPEKEFSQLSHLTAPLTVGQHDIWITSNVTEVKIPVHSFLLKARSKVMRQALNEFYETYYFSIPDVLAIEYGEDGQIRIQFQAADFLTITNFAFYLYTDDVLDVWHYTSRALRLASRYRSVRIELMKIASSLEMRQLERAVRVMTEPVKCLTEDLALAARDKDYFSDADVLVQLADEIQVPAHSSLLCSRCPFFDGLFNGRAGGFWMQARRGEAEKKFELMKVDLKHVRASVFEKVLMYLYADAGAELFDDVVTNDLDEFIDLVVEIMSVANELMIDRLSQICQQVLGQFANMRNICSLLNTVAECTVEEFKFVGLEYICLNLESMLENRYLEELDPDILFELDEVVRQNQLAFMPFSRSSRAEEELLDRYPELASRISRDQQRRLDSIRLRTRLVEDEDKPTTASKVRIGSLEKSGTRSASSLLEHSADDQLTPSPSPVILAKKPTEDLLFEMDDNEAQFSGMAEVNSPAQRKSPSEPTQKGIPVTIPISSPQATRLEFGRVGSDSVALPEATLSTPIRVSGFEVPRPAWQTSPQSTRTDLRDIMNQTASSSQVSALSQALSNSSPLRPKPSSKISQRERKRQQQEQQQKAEDSAVTIPERSALTPTASNSATPQSPWKSIPGRQKTPLSPLITSGSQTESQSPVTSSIPSQILPPEPKPPTVRQSSQPKTVRDVPKSEAKPPTTPQIQSIRHTPTRTQSAMALDARTSMAEILAQQQFEKAAIKEAVAKRSLQEIQQEQEFQEWWNQESQRVQEEQAARAKEAERRQSRNGRGRGGGRHRRKSEVKAEDGSAQNVDPLSPTPSSATAAEPSRGRGRGGGPRGGGGRGGRRGDVRNKPPTQDRAEGSKV